MSINQAVMTALKEIGVPVRFQTYTGTADSYITFLPTWKNRSNMPMMRSELPAIMCKLMYGARETIPIWLMLSMKRCWLLALLNRTFMTCMKMI